MQGYLTMALEADEQMVAPPTHIFLQAGVGSMAAAVAAYFAQAYPQNPPKIILVEPTAADCFFRSAAKGEITAVKGDMPTMMAGLACGEPSPIAWDILKGLTAAYLSCGDAAAARGMRALARPLEGDKAIVSGESGAATMGALLDAAADEKARAALGLDWKRAGAALLHGGRYGPGELSEGDGGRVEEMDAARPDGRAVVCQAVRR